MNYSIECLDLPDSYDHLGTYDFNPSIPLEDQETNLSFNEKEKGVLISSKSKRMWNYFERMGIEPYRKTDTDRWYNLESKHQIVIKVKPSKQARCSKDSCTC